METSKDVAAGLRTLADDLRKKPFEVVDMGLLQQALRGGAAEIEQLRARLQNETPASLEVAALRRVIDRHVRWRDKALRLLQQVNTGYEGEWPEIADFVQRSITRIEQSTADNSRDSKETPACICPVKSGDLCPVHHAKAGGTGS